ncbi:hypothetical protein FALCPG4_018418 [Fusarium falciforme]
MYRYTNISQPFDHRPPHGGMSWVEIPAVDVAASKKFYQSLFPAWKFGNETRNPDEFISLFKIEEPSYIEGAIIKVNPNTLTASNNSQTNSIGMVVYFLVDSIDEMHAKILDLGGEVCLEKTDARGDGWYAKYLDIAGNVFCIYEVAFKQ